jgi:peptidoglycan/LPS O-acetylase OafA/YrhL
LTGPANDPSGAAPRHRPEIDGLRAIAIVPVVLYHAGFKILSGGFSGVDVFFVISGFLITSIIYGDIRKGRFSIAAFYERRVRRIIPALSAMLAVSTVLACLMLMPDAFRQFGRSVAATTAFVSNILFARESGYFGVAAETKPLIHTWSVAVEEQFYIFYPILLYLLFRYRRTLVPATAFAVLVASFTLAVWGVRYAPEASFYLAPMRAWELMLGAILALGVLPASGNRVLNNVLSLVGVALIGWGMFGLSSESGFPGTGALFPGLGCALIIYSTGPAAGGTLVGSILSTPPFRAIGLISYSLYLWHWPLLIFAKYFAIRQMTQVETLGVVGLAVAVSVLSWHFIEQPFRGKSGAFSRKVVFAGAGCLMALFLSVGIAIDRFQGFPSRFAPDVIQPLEQDQVVDAEHAHCYSLNAPRRGRLCRIGDTSTAAPTFLLWGDSHAMAIMPGLDQAGVVNHAAGLVAGRPGCQPLLGVYRQVIRTCLPYNNEVLALAERSSEIRVVFLVGRWGIVANATQYRNKFRPNMYIRDDSTREQSVLENRRVFARGLRRTVDRLVRAGKRVIIVAQVPEVGYDVPLTMARMRLFRRFFEIRPTRTEYLEYQRNAMDAMAALAAEHLVEVIHPDEVLCAAIFCDVEQGGHPLYFDDHHLSAYGARYLARLFDPVLQSAP